MSTSAWQVFRQCKHCHALTALIRSRTTLSCSILLNEPAEIQEAFRQYYEGSVMGEEVDPDKLYEVKSELDASGIYLQSEVAEFTQVFFAPKPPPEPW
jgi:hypothetical protein